MKVEAKADVDAKKNGEESPVDVLSNLSSIGQEQFGTGGPEWAVELMSWTKIPS